MSTSDRIQSNIATQSHRDVNNNIYIFYNPDKDSGQYLVFGIFSNSVPYGLLCCSLLSIFYVLKYYRVEERA